MPVQVMSVEGVRTKTGSLPKDRTISRFLFIPTKKARSQAAGGLAGPTPLGRTASLWGVFLSGTNPAHPPQSSPSSPLHASRIHLKGLTGSAGKISSISQPGSDFSTKDADKDRCICKCAQMLTGGRPFLFVWARALREGK